MTGVDKSLEARLLKLERRNRVLGGALLSLVLLATCAALMGAASTRVPEVIRAQRIEITTPDGRAMVRLGHGPEGGHAHFTNTTGEDLVELRAATGGGMIWTRAASGRRLVELGWDGTGAGRAKTYNGEGLKIVEIGTSPAGKGGITAYNPRGRVEKHWPSEY
jgi:hypothetical protein